jgi:hypothetical protein
MSETNTEYELEEEEMEPKDRINKIRNLLNEEVKR